MKILPLSDIHGNHNIYHHIIDNYNVEDYDVVTITGDLWEYVHCDTEQVDSLVDFQKEIDKPIVLIQGNHDYWSGSLFDEIDNIHLLHNTCVTIDGVKFFGTPYTTTFMDWNWMLNEEKLYECWNSLMPDDADVVLSHGPPLGYCDNCNQAVYNNDADTHLGSTSLLTVLLDKNPKYVFCGHIHTGDREGVLDNGTKVINASCLDEAYKFLGWNPAPSIVELEL